MEIQCPECLKKYKIDENLVPDKGRKVKCKKCSNVFFVQKEKPEQMEDHSEFNVDLNFSEPSPAGGGTVRISKEQIQASLNKMNESSENAVPQMDITDSLEVPPVEIKKQSHDFEPEKPEDHEELEETNTVAGVPIDNVYDVRIEGKIYENIEESELVEWIKEDRLMESDEVTRSGTKSWVKAESVPKLRKEFSMHVYQQRKALEEEDNPYKRFVNEQENQEKKEPSGGFIEKIMKIFKR